MAHFLDKPSSGSEFLDASSEDSDLAPDMMVQYAAAQSTMVSGTFHGKQSLREPSSTMLPLPNNLLILWQYPVHNAVDDKPLLDNLERLLAIRIDPMDLKMCTFGGFVPVPSPGMTFPLFKPFSPFLTQNLSGLQLNLFMQSGRLPGPSSKGCLNPNAQGSWLAPFKGNPDFLSAWTWISLPSCYMEMMQTRLHKTSCLFASNTPPWVRHKLSLARYCLAALGGVRLLYV